MKMFCLECLAFVEKYGILNPTWFPMFRIHFLVFSPLQGDRWWSFAVVAASALERISTSGGDPECKSLTISLPSKFEISFRLGRLRSQNENAWGVFSSEKISAIHFSRGFDLEADIVFVTGSPLERATRWAGGLNGRSAPEKPAIHWFSLYYIGFLWEFVRFSGTLKCEAAFHLLAVGPAFGGRFFFENAGGWGTSFELPPTYS